MSKDVSASILQNVLQIGHLDFSRAMDLLMQLTESKEGQLFEKSQAGSLFVCRYSNTQSYTVDEKYTTDALPANQYTIFHRATIIATVCLSNQDAFDDLPEDMQQRIHDSICIGLVMGHLWDSKYAFTISVCNALSNIISKVIDMFDAMAKRMRGEKRYVDQINSYLNDVMTIIYDTIDYLEIDSERVQLQKNVVNMADFLHEVSTQYETIFSHKVNIDLQDRAKRPFVFDKRWVQQMLISLLKRCVDIPNLQLQVSLSNGTILIFRIYSTVLRSNAEIMQKLQAEKISVDSLDVFVVKRLCDIMQGKFELDTDGVNMAISVERA